MLLACKPAQQVREVFFVYGFFKQHTVCVIERKVAVSGRSFRSACIGRSSIFKALFFAEIDHISVFMAFIFITNYKMCAKNKNIRERKRKTVFF